MKRASSIPPQRSTFRSSEARSLHSSMYFDRIRPSSSLTDGTARKTTARTVPGDFQDDPSCTATAAQSFWNAIISSASFPEKVCSRPCECSIHSLKPNNLSYTQQASTSVSLSINSRTALRTGFSTCFSTSFAPSPSSSTCPTSCPFLAFLLFFSVFFRGLLSFFLLFSILLITSSNPIPFSTVPSFSVPSTTTSSSSFNNSVERKSCRKAFFERMTPTEMTRACQRVVLQRNL